MDRMILFWWHLRNFWREWALPCLVLAAFFSCLVMYVMCVSAYGS